MRALSGSRGKVGGVWCERREEPKSSDDCAAWGSLAKLASKIISFSHDAVLTEFPKRFYLGCVKSLPRPDAGSRNLGKAFLRY